MVGINCDDMKVHFADREAGNLKEADHPIHAAKKAKNVW
jgi:hypothetical protein